MVERFNKTMDYGHTKPKTLIHYSPNSNPKIHIWDVLIKASFFVEKMIEKWKTWTRNSLYQKGC